VRRGPAVTLWCSAYLAGVWAPVGWRHCYCCCVWRLLSMRRPRLNWRAYMIHCRPSTTAVILRWEYIVASSVELGGGLV